MKSDPPAKAAQHPASRGRMRRVGRRFAIAVGLAALAGVAGYAFIASELALRLAVQVLIDRSEGRLAVEAPTGSLLSTVRIKHLSWKGPEATLSADEIAVNWNPLALGFRGIVVKGLGAQRISLSVQASDSAVPLPASLALPTRIAIEDIAVAEFNWRVGTNEGSFKGVTFGYAFDATSHRVDKLSFVAPHGTLTGGAKLDAQPPFAIAGKFAFTGDVSQKEARADFAVSGTIDAVAVDGSGSAGDARFALQAKLTPLAAVALGQLTLDAQDVDIRAWNATLPSTRLGVKIDARPLDGGLAGSVEARNAIPGPIDGERVPVRSLAARFVWRADALTLDDLVLEMTGSGRAAGRAAIPLDGSAGKWALDVRDIDLRQIHTSLVSTRLSGTLGADLDVSRQKIDGRVADRTIVGGVSVSFAATVADRRLVIERLQVRASDGELAGSGRIDLANHRAFEFSAKATRIDPSRFGNFPPGSLEGDVAASGTLEPSLRADVKIAVAAGSKLKGVPLSGTMRGMVAARTVRDAVVDLNLASARLTARGGTGENDEGLKVSLDAPKLAELAPLLAPRVPRPLSGALRASATMRGPFDRGGLELTVHGEALKVGPALALGTIDASVSIAPATSPGGAAAADQRRLQVEIAATAMTAPPGTFPRAQAKVEGTLAQHKASLSFVGADLDVDATAHGSARETGNAGEPGGWTWSGTLDTLENRGLWALHLATPATLAIARGHVEIGAARIDVADGRVDLKALSWDDGHVTTRGEFAGVPVATAAKFAGVSLPFASTLTVAGDWSIAAAPRLNGTVTLRRERGDLFFGPDAAIDADNRAFRITIVELNARFTEDAIAATAAVKSGRGVNVEARLDVGVAPDAPPGHIAPNAPLSLALTADLATLKVLQPWAGTTAIIDGNAHAELNASGTVARAPFSGTVRAGSLRIEAPQYGLFFIDGRLNARLVDGALELDELSFAGGAGRFTASGRLAAPGDVPTDVQSAAGTITWHAEKFRVLNRPDLRLVVGGSGTLSLKNRKVSLDGALTADEGHFEYRPQIDTTLGDDVVVKGWPARDRSETRGASVPIAIDLEVDLGQNLTFTGEGLESGLRGKVRVTTAADGTFRGRGSIQASNGIYRAFGQRLVIERGRLIFDGPLDNPGLDIVALRKNLAVEAGVAVSGTVKVPIIQLTSIPPVPDNEKLSWLVLGQGLDRTSGSDIAALQAASAALLGRGGKSVTATVAESIGLDDISVGRGTNAPRGSGRSTPDASGQVVAFGKRISDDLSLVYEQGLTVASNALRLEYSLTRTLTLRAEAGAISSFGVYYRRVFD
ncbi:MAG: translocation/assembly module TamB domain-containing protein [Betaproteobacteria bacterium]